MPQSLGMQNINKRSHCLSQFPELIENAHSNSPSISTSVSQNLDQKYGDISINISSHMDEKHSDKNSHEQTKPTIIEMTSNQKEKVSIRTFQEKIEHGSLRELKLARSKNKKEKLQKERISCCADKDRTVFLFPHQNKIIASVFFGFFITLGLTILLNPKNAHIENNTNSTIPINNSTFVDNTTALSYNNSIRFQPCMIAHQPAQKNNSRSTLKNLNRIAKKQHSLSNKVKKNKYNFKH